MSTQLIMPTVIAGKATFVHVDHYLKIEAYNGSAWHCDNDRDYYGYMEICFSVVDQNGKPDEDIAALVTPTIHRRIEHEIARYMHDQERFNLTTED